MIKILHLVFWAMISFYSCSTIKNVKQKISGEDKYHLTLTNYSLYDEKDFLDHLYSLNSFLKNNSSIKIKNFNSANEQYLFSIYEKILKNNELLIHPEKNIKFYIIDSEIPFYFSLPPGSIYFSKGLLQKYIRHEGDLISIIALEMIKSFRNLYNKNIIVPLGFISLDRIMALTRISLKTKLQINKWAFYSLKRSGYDPYFVLIWIQQLNRNSLDFFLQLGDTKTIAREEYLLKTFLLNKKQDIKISKVNKNSSRIFYNFINDIKEEKNNVQ